jgi:hypothetical protein
MVYPGYPTGASAGAILPPASELSQEVSAMRALPEPLETVDVRITQWMARYVVTLRVALGRPDSGVYAGSWMRSSQYYPSTRLGE